MWGDGSGAGYKLRHNTEFQEDWVIHSDEDLRFNH